MSSLTITTIQTGLHWENKAANLQMLTEKISSIGNYTEVVVLPEMFNTGFSMQPQKLAETMDGPAVEWMKATAAAKKVILTGSLMIEEEGRYYNRLIWMLPNGQYGFYNKRHLFAFGQEDQHFSAGNKRLITSVKGWRINVQVCYDLRFPVWARQHISHDNNDQPNPEYDLLLYVANWPERRNHAWKTLLQARAIENQSFVVGVNRVGNDGNNIYHSGDSMIIDPMGGVLYHKEHTEDIFTITLNKDTLTEARTKFPFWKDADEFMLLKDH